MIFNSAGHYKQDPGAVANGYKEADLTIEFRDLLNKELKALGAKTISDKDEENLGEYLSRIKTGDGSVVHEVHFNAATPSATGIEIVIPDRHTTDEFNCARELAAAINQFTGLKLRGDKGVITESATHRGKLAVMRPEGLNVLTEMCFISNPNDLEKYFAAKHSIAKAFAVILKKYDDAKQ